MNFIKKLFGKSDNPVSKRIFKIDELLKSDNLNHSIIEFDNYVSELCNWGDQMDRLTPQQKSFYYNQNLEREINNGGFHQYFSNSSGNFAHETVSSLKEIGAMKTSDILQVAINQFPNSHVSADREQRQKTLEQIEESAAERFEELDQSFFKYEDDLNSLNIEYIKRNKDKF